MPRTMKDSGIDWIGSIPTNWEIIRTKSAFKNHKYIAGKKSPDYERLALTLNGVIKRSKDDSTGLQPEAFDGYQILRPGELVFKLIDLENLQTSRVGLSPYEGIVSPAYIILEPNNTISPEYAEMFFLSMWQRAIFNRMGDDGVRSSLTAGDLLKVPFTLPPLDEQRKIASFLKKKFKEINSIIEDTEKSIEEYKLLKQSLITEAVTKGIRGERPMKNSGVEWIGDIPEDWELIRIKSIFNNRKEKNNPVKTDFILSLGLNYGVVPYSEKGAAGNKAKEDVSAYLIAHPGDIVMNSMNIVSGSVGISEYLGCVSPVYYMLYPKNEKTTNKNYFYNVFQTKVFQRSLLGLGNGILVKESSNGTLNTVRLRIPYEKLGIQLVPQPPKKEQDEISEYVIKRTSKIDKLVEEKRAFIDELNKYKKAIIYEYVTGKKEVPEL